MDISVVSEGARLRASDEYSDGIFGFLRDMQNVWPLDFRSGAPLSRIPQRTSISGGDSTNMSAVNLVRFKAMVGFVGGAVIEMTSGCVRIEWPSAASWHVYWRGAATDACLDLRSVLAAAYYTGDCVVGLDANLLAAVDREDVLRAMDMQRRKRLGGGGKDVAFSGDDVFVEDIKLRILKCLQAELEGSQWAHRVRSLGLAARAPTDEELLASGPSLDADAFDEATCDFVATDTAEWSEVAP